MDLSKDYYAILGVLPTAENMVIRAVYKTLAQHYHPDRNAGVNAHNRMVEINEAYSVLSDLVLKEQYDIARSANRNSAEGYFGDTGASDSEDSFESSDDPLEIEWRIATKYFPHLQNTSDRLKQFSKRLAYTFKTLLVENKSFSDSEQIAESMEEEFIKIFFGRNIEIQQFALLLIYEGHRAAALELNKAIRVLGSEVAPAPIIDRLTADYSISTSSRAVRAGTLISIAEARNKNLKAWINLFHFDNGSYNNDWLVVWRGRSFNLGTEKRFIEWMRENVVPSLQKATTSKS